MNDSFWHRLEALVAGAELEIDRPRGSAHPRYPEVIYPLDYGHLLGTTGGDGEAVDIWLGSIPAHPLTAVVCTVDLVKKDVELKLLLGCTKQEQQTILQFHTGEHAGALLIERV